MNVRLRSNVALHLRGEVSSESDWAYFAGVGDGQSLEDSPWDTAKDFSSKQRVDGLCGEENCCKATNADQACNDSLSNSQ